MEKLDKKVAILVVEDNVLNQKLIFLNLSKLGFVIDIANNGQEALEKIKVKKYDLVLMDLMMPIMDGIQATEIIRRDQPEVEVIALTSVLEDASVVGAVRAGAIGYLLKDTQADELSRAIHAAANGQVQLSPQAAARLVREVRAPESPEKLTDREMDVLRLLALGKANKEIAAELFISETTVKTHVSNILMKLGVPSRTQAALYAVRIGLVPGGNS